MIGCDSGPRARVGLAPIAVSSDRSTNWRTVVLGVGYRALRCACFAAHPRGTRYVRCAICPCMIESQASGTPKAGHDLTRVPASGVGGYNQSDESSLAVLAPRARIFFRLALLILGYDRPCILSIVIVLAGDFASASDNDVNESPLHCFRILGILICDTRAGLNE